MSLLIDERQESLQKLLDAKREMRKMHDPELMKHQHDPPVTVCGQRSLTR